ncbi:MAG: hypothetical protein K0Q74_269 [Gammaproteobacteria bacterium]|jgi:hypothetical protein|nr:hypothetical protein [Gammaproteobacteria bacterium]
MFAQPTEKLLQINETGKNMPLDESIEKLRAAYPEYIQAVSKHELIWKDGTRMPLGQPSSGSKLENPSLRDQLMQASYPTGKLTDEALSTLFEDPGRIRYQPFFTKMYGASYETVQANLTTFPWMPKIFSEKFPISVTTINGVDQKLQRISSALSELPATYHRFLSEPFESFVWREIAGTNRLSAHSLGIALDINVAYSHYWQWDLETDKKPVHENTALIYRNQIPWEIVLIFEQQGFIWGGKWHHYDTMHFEYRPELISLPPGPL